MNTDLEMEQVGVVLVEVEFEVMVVEVGRTFVGLTIEVGVKKIVVERTIVELELRIEVATIVALERRIEVATIVAWVLRIVELEHTIVGPLIEVLVPTIVEQEQAIEVMELTIVEQEQVIEVMEPTIVEQVIVVEHMIGLGMSCQMIDRQKIRPMSHLVVASRDLARS
jgi:hypothetical protein